MPNAAHSTPPPATPAFLDGLRAAATSVLSLVLFGTYVGIGALAHDYGFSPVWLVLSTVLVWAGPAQVILLSALGTGATVFESALAVGLSGMRLLPMVVSLLPLIKQPETRMRELVLPAHLTAISMWVECLRLLPGVPRERRIPFCNGVGAGFLIAAEGGGVTGFYLAASLPLLFSAGLLFLTPMSFLISTVRNAKLLVDRLALVFGFVLGPWLAYREVELDLLWTGLAAGSVAYGIHRLRMALR
jgi:predicted branched-subunit amino acid permease